ncbi:hypothetical protein PENTCL1PPCAC_25290 [Pristionchus entomophagus]|uniref:Uncharacterized protein n=1 Tax=Pristionchus entomophagus TaxID=358040 RepID=A0AAV5U892_9BILA|nr:hypothetical protein PENTCL1PPCAC_25290 [Pristionchus entomophagus]
MTQILRCVIEDRFCVTGIVRGGQKSLRNAKPSDISLELRQIDSDEVLVSKSLPWPTGEELPSKIKYDSKDEVLLVQNRTTLAKIPLRSRALKALGEQNKKNTPAGPRIASTFEENDQDDKSEEYAKVMAAIRDVISDSSDAKWKKLKKVMTSKLELSSLFTATVQAQLLKVIESKTASGDKDVQAVLKSLVASDFFGYKMLNHVHSLCESSSLDAIIDDLVLSHPIALPEKTFVKCLKKAAGSGEKSKNYLKKLLDLPFEDKNTAAVAGTILSSSEAAALIGHLVEMYKDEEESQRHGKVLSLLSLLLDSHSTHFLNDPQTHDAMLEAASFIAAMTALTGTFADLECTRKARGEIKLAEPETPDFQIRTVRLEVRNSPSADVKEQNKKEAKKK